MNLNSLSIIQSICLYALPLLFAITLHEVAHGWVAYACGDSTAKALGRLSLNPLKHIDPFGTVILPLITLLFGGVIFGWAKPVPVNWHYLHHPRRDMFWVSLAGPLSNLFMALAWGLITKLGLFFAVTYVQLAQILVNMGEIGIQINLIFMLLNLLPIPPLDGSKVLMACLPPRWAFQFQWLEQYGFIILIVLLMSGILGRLLMPSLSFLMQLIIHGLNLS